ncbi:ribonuclease H-like domain-containing protein [Chytridium lagenaria]|nr:ribonuclease H-like domain-containing protein [Chytridium lagenaria]
MDTEMSGLSRDNSDNLDLMDDLEARYGRVRRSAQEFAVVQYGICTFTWDAKQGAYVAKPFNFPIFPSTGNSVFGLHRSFMTHPGAFEFLVKNEFDFNRWVKTGVPYLNRDDENAVRHRIGKLSNHSEIPIDDGNKEFLDAAMKEINDWLQNSPDKTISVSAHNSYRRRLVHQEVKKRFNSYLRTEGKGLVVEVTKLSVEERNKGGDTEHLLDALDELIGFRKVIDIISQAKKPVIGHNLYLDLCHTLEKFHQSLPPSILDFKDEAHKLFPTIYDTKFIAMGHARLRELIPISNLSDLFKQVSTSKNFTKPSIVVHPDFTDYGDSSDKFHEAGYDAYATGVCFAKMLGEILFTEGGRIRLSDPTLLEFSNKLYLMRSDSPFLNLAGDNDGPQRENLVYFRDFPREWKVSEIQKRLAPAFGSFYVRWIDDTSCFLALRDPSKLEEGLQIFMDAQEAGSLPLCLRASTYEEYMVERRGVAMADMGGMPKKRKIEAVDEVRAVRVKEEAMEEGDAEKEWTPNTCRIS